MYEAASPADFLASATPGAGKTAFALMLALQLKQRRVIDRIIVVAPTDHLRTQWADSAAEFGLVLDPRLKNSVGPVRPGDDGYVTTYAQVAAHPMRHRRRTELKKSMVILDEIHHAGDSLSWGEAAYEAFEPATRRVALTGTPFRTKSSERIPFVRYERSGQAELVSVADYTYGYRDGLRDAVVRPVVFAAYSGTSRWMNSAGEVLSASLSEPLTRKHEEAAWRTALDPNGQWIPHVVAAADHRLSDMRQAETPDAAGLMLATDQETARAYAKIVAKVTGHKPVLVLSDDPRSSNKIAAFNHSDARWLVAVRQVSEGVDLPRLGVCLWATSYRTPLFFSQAVGRVVRARTPRETATVFLPAVRPLLMLAAEIEAERNHVIQVAAVADGGLDEFALARVETEPGLGSEITSLDAEAEFAHLLHAGRAIVASPVALAPEDEEYLGLPGLLTPEQTASLLATRDAGIRKRAKVLMSVGEPALSDPQISASWRDADELRKEISQLVGLYAARKRRRHAEVHVELRQVAPGPASASAPVETLVLRRDWLLARTS